MAPRKHSIGPASAADRAVPGIAVIVNETEPFCPQSKNAAPGATNTRGGLKGSKFWQSYYPSILQ